MTKINSVKEIKKIIDKLIIPGYHFNNIYHDKELDESSICKNFLQVQKEGNRNVKRNIGHYNLDMIIALGYRVQSDVAVRFRIWATKRLHEYIQKNFALGDDRLKQVFKPYYEDSLKRKYEKMYILNNTETLEDCLIKDNIKLIK